MSHLEAIPVDTHVLKIASEHYLPIDRKTKSITIKRYNEIGDAFRDVYGSLAGWAQTGNNNNSLLLLCVYSRIILILITAYFQFYFALI